MLRQALFRPAVGHKLKFSLLLPLCCALFLLNVGCAENMSVQMGVPRIETHVMWLNHAALQPGDPSVQTSSHAVSSDVGGGLTALVVQSATTGEIAEGGGNKVVQMAVQVPPGYKIVGVRVAYELTSSRSFISQIRLAQVQNPPDKALVILDDRTNQTAPGPVTIDSETTLINPELGPVLLSLRVNFGSTSDKIAIRGLGLILRPHPT